MAASINKATSDSRFVSVFADSTPDVDITFMVPFLQRPTDHYLVGVDDLTISLSALGLLDDQETGEKAVILKVLRRRRVGGTNNPLGPVVPTEFLLNSDELKQIAAFQQRSVILSVNEFIIELNRFGARISAHIEEGISENDNIWTSPAASDVATPSTNGKHLGFYLTPDGRLAIIGSKIFWSQFLFHIPNRKYQRILGIDKEFLSLSATKGYEMGDINSSKDFAKAAAIVKTLVGGAARWTLSEFDPTVDGINRLRTLWKDSVNGVLWKDQSHIWLSSNCLLSSLDRRVSIELGASLPMLNSPMVEFGQETPDFVLGRWMFPRNAESTIRGGSSDHGTAPQVSITQKDTMGVITLQGSKDRVLYHTLRPQSKIQTVRLRLFARVRTYDDVNDSWGMKTMAVPTNVTDWWHARLHFVSKD